MEGGTAAVNEMTSHDVVFSELAGLLASPLDPVLSDPTRLRIQAALHALPGDAAMSFTLLRKALGLTDGNLGQHVRVLMDAGFAETEERWRGKRRTTLYRATSAGRAGFDAHVRALNAIIEASATTVTPDPGQGGVEPARRGG
jgi:DNA-binding transcriptional ArsR family regulator